MSYQSANCFYKECDRCNTKGCGCSCHIVNDHAPVIQFIQNKRPKSSLKKRKERLIQIMDPDLERYDTND